MQFGRTIIGLLLSTWALTAAAAAKPPVPRSVSDYDHGDVYLIRGGRQERYQGIRSGRMTVLPPVYGGRRQPYHGMRKSWVFNRAMVWLDRKAGVEDAVICYSSESPLLLTGRKQVSRWYVGPTDELADVDDQFTRFVKKDPKYECGHVSLPPFQFHIQQHPIAELEVSEATHPWQLFVVVKGRTGEPLYTSPWQSGPGKLTVDVLNLYRKKGYGHHFAEFHFFVETWTKDPKEQAEVVFRLRLNGRPVIVPSLPIIRTTERADREGTPIYAVVLDENANRLGKDTVELTASVGKMPIKLTERGNGIWKAIVRRLPAGQHKVRLRATWKQGGKTADSTLRVHITDGKFVGYDPKLRLLTDGGKPIGPATGSYRGQYMFKRIGTPGESPLHGQKQWDAVHAGRKTPDYDYHFWESLTEQELDADYAYLARCGWSATHICAGWLWWERFNCGGRITPHGAEQLALILAAARSHGLHVQVALSHYPIAFSFGTPLEPYARFVEAGYKRSDYKDPKSKLYKMADEYHEHFTTIFGDETAILSLTASGEGDRRCGKTFVNAAYDQIRARDKNHLFLCEPIGYLEQDPNYYRKQGWKPVIGGMRNYGMDHYAPEAIGVQFKLAALGDVYMAEGLFWGFMTADSHLDRYRLRVRQTVYTGLVYRNPVMVSWEERVVEDERVVLEQVRQAVDWSKPFATPRLALRVGKESMYIPDPGRAELFLYENALAGIPLEYVCVWEDGPVPPGTLHTIDARGPFRRPGFVSDGGKMPDELKAHMPLQLPDGLTANYSWTDDRRTLLAFIEKRDPAGRHHRTTLGGPYTFADTVQLVQRDTVLDTWEVECVKPGAVQLRIYRRACPRLMPFDHGTLTLVGQSKLAEMTKVGMNRFSLKEPISAKKGDCIGFHIPGRDTRIAAHYGGRAMYIEGPASEARTPMPLTGWKTETKLAHISVFNAAEPPESAVPESAASESAASESTGPKRPPGIILQNFPPGKLSFRLFDLTAKKVVLEGDFQKTLTLEVPAEGRHFFLLTNDRDADVK